MSWSPKPSGGQSPRHQGWRVYSHRERENAGGGVKEALGDKDSKSKESGRETCRAPGSVDADWREISTDGAGRNGLMRQKKKKPMTEGGRCLGLENAGLRVRVERV